MKQKIRSIKRSSFYKMFKSSMVLILLNFIVVSIFVITLSYMLMSNNQVNLANIIIDNITEKEERVIKTSKNIAAMYSEEAQKSYRKLFIEETMQNEEDIDGILILDNNGIIIETTLNCKSYQGIDFSGRDYFKKVMRDRETFLSDAYVAQLTGQQTINIVSPIISDKEVKGVVVTMLSPKMIQNKNIKEVEYYLANTNGDIIFHSSDNVVRLENNILDTKLIDNISKGITSPLVYKDKIKNKYVLGTLRVDSNHSMYIIVQQNIFGNKILYTGLGILLAAAFLIVLIFLLLFSAKFSSVVTSYINIFTNEAKKISIGNYDVDISETYPYLEANEIINIFMNMAKKVKQREEEMQAYNEELIAANDEIRDMINTISENEKEKKEQYIEILWTLLNFLEIKDEYTAEHSRAVTEYTDLITDKLNSEYGFMLNKDKIQVAAVLHDIGKISIERDILTKPSKLTKEEFEIIKSHVINGYHALKDIKNMKDEREMIKHHHEKYGGGGYPDGIRGDSIPLGARIICVADAFDAMISDRPYRKGMSIEVAVEELKRNKGTQFDPLIVDVFVDVLKQQGLAGA